MKADQQLKVLLIDFFARYGVQAIPLPEREGLKTADFRVNIKDEVYFIELKQRDQKSEFVSAFESASIGEIRELDQEAAEYRNSISKTIREGVKQLAQTLENEFEFKLLWLHASDEDSDLDAKQFEATLCGEVFLYCVEISEVRSCYFFDESEFFKCRHSLDGAFVSTSEEVKLILNPYSNRFEYLQESSLVKLLGGAAWDPLRLEKEGKVLIADCNIDRRNKEEVLKFVSDKYALQLNVIDLRRNGFLIRTQ